MSAPLYLLIIRLLGIVEDIIKIYMAVIFVAVVVSWLVAFGVINLHHPVVRQIVRILESLTEPVFRRIRRFVPPIGGIDLSPLILLLLLQVVIVLIDFVADLARSGLIGMHGVL